MSHRPRYLSRRSNVIPFDALEVRCWCEAEIVLVSPADVRALRTGKCGRSGCEPPEEAEAVS